MLKRLLSDRRTQVLAMGIRLNLILRNGNQTEKDHRPKRSRRTIFPHHQADGTNTTQISKTQWCMHGLTDDAWMELTEAHVGIQLTPLHFTLSIYILNVLAFEITRGK